MSDDDLTPLLGHVLDGDYYVGAWFLAGPKRDFMAVLYRDAAGTLQLSSRVRYYAPEDGRNDPFDGRDEKHPVYGTIPEGKTEDEAIVMVDKLIDHLVSVNFCGTRLAWRVRKLRYRIIVKADGNAFKHALLKQPFVHMKVPGGRRNGGPAN